MPITEGTTNFPTDTSAKSGLGALRTSDSNLYLDRQDAHGSKQVVIYSADGNPLFTPASSAFTDSDGSGSLATTAVATLPRLFNSSSWDREYNNTQGTLLASAARTATTATADQTNCNARGVVVWVKVSAIGTGHLTVDLLVRHQPDGEVIGWSGATPNITGTNDFAIVAYPGNTFAVTSQILVSTSLPLPRTWLVQVNHSDSSSWTYSVGFSLVV